MRLLPLFPPPNAKDGLARLGVKCCLQCRRSTPAQSGPPLEPRPQQQHRLVRMKGAMLWRQPLYRRRVSGGSSANEDANGVAADRNGELQRMKNGHVDGEPGFCGALLAATASAAFAAQVLAVPPRPLPPQPVMAGLWPGISGEASVQGTMAERA